MPSVYIEMVVTAYISCVKSARPEFCVVVDVVVPSLAQNDLVFFFQAEDGIRDRDVTWSSDVCSSDLPTDLLIGAVQVTARLLGGRPLSESVGYLKLLAAYDIVFVSLASFLFRFTVDE